MVAAYARLGQTASIALELGKCGRLNTLLGALVNTGRMPHEVLVQLG